MLGVPQEREVLGMKNCEQNLPVLVPQASPLLLGHLGVRHRRHDQAHLHAAALRIGGVGPEGEELEVIRLPQQGAVGKQEMGFRDVLGQASVAGVFLDPPIDRLARGDETAVTWFQPEEFTDPAIAKRERDLIFGRVPSIVAHGSEIPRSGDFFTLQMPRNNIIVVRQRDGGVKTFVNLCRHRGALLEKEEKGRCRLFSCPYHRWSYDTDGTLRTITRDNTFGETDTSSMGLVELPTEERHGFIWVVDEANAEIDVAGWLGNEMDAILSGYDLDSKIAVQSEGFDEPVNWKIMQDAFLDGYHIQYAHPSTAAKHIMWSNSSVVSLRR